MDISDGSQYAVQVALQTLKDRCNDYKHHVRVLEEENLTLRLKCEHTVRTNLDSITEIDRLNARITELIDQNTQQQRNNTMITSENRKLWSQLSTLCIANKTMGDHIAKVNNYINDPKLQSQSTLIRSRTFTHEAAPLKYTAKCQDGDRNSLELEEISLKTGDCHEVDSVYLDRPQIMDNILTSSFAFGYQNDSNNTTIEYFENNLIDLKAFKETLLKQNQMLKSDVSNFSNTKVEYTCSKCAMNHHKQEKEAIIVDTKQYLAQHVEEGYVKSTNDTEHSSGSTNERRVDLPNLPDLPNDTSREAILTNEKREQMPKFSDLPAEMSRELDSLANWVTPENSNEFFNDKENKINARVDTNDQICPMCNRLFLESIPFDVFQKHVEEHFLQT